LTQATCAPIFSIQILKFIPNMNETVSTILSTNIDIIKEHYFIVLLINLPMI
jgi:hypothetical protein